MTPSPLKAILFDWDNTLASTWGVIFDSINATMSQFNKPLWTMDQIKRNAHTSARDSFPQIFGNQWPEAYKYFYDHYKNVELNQLTLCEGVPEVLEFFKSIKIPMGIVSNKKGMLLRQEVEHFKLKSYFSAVIGAEDAAQDKPSPAPLFLALQEMSIEPGLHVWMVGDTPIDYQAGINAGCYPIYIGEGKTFPNTILKLNELVNLYDQING